MGLKFLPNHILTKMYPEDRKKLGKMGMLPKEINAKAAKCAEKVLQDQCESWLRRNDIFYLRMPMHKPTCIRVGWADFTIFLPGGKAILMEMKVEGGKISEDQRILHEEYAAKTGRRVFLIVNYDQFVSQVQMEAARPSLDNTCEPPGIDSTSPVPPKSS